MSVIVQAVKCGLQLSLDAPQAWFLMHTRCLQSQIIASYSSVIYKVADNDMAKGRIISLAFSILSRLLVCAITAHWPF